jgi:hypothetical protein
MPIWISCISGKEMLKAGLTCSLSVTLWPIIFQYLEMHQTGIGL